MEQSDVSSRRRCFSDETFLPAAADVDVDATLEAFARQQLAERKQSPLPAAAARVSRKTRDRPVGPLAPSEGTRRRRTDGRIRMNDGGGGGGDVRKTRGVADP